MMRQNAMRLWKQLSKSWTLSVLQHTLLQEEAPLVAKMLRMPVVGFCFAI